MYKILFIITGLGTGGAEMMLYKLLSRIDRNHFAPVVISLMNSDKELDNIGSSIQALDIPVYGLGMINRKPKPASIARLINLVNQVKPDLIQGWMYHANFVAQLMRILTFKSTPVIWNIRHSLYSLDYEKKGTAFIINILAKLSNFPAKIIYNSHIGAIQHKKIGYQNNKTIVIPNGFDLELFRPALPSRLSLRRELGVPEKTFLIGRISRFHPMKGHDNFLRAAALLLKNYPDIHFVLAGTEVNHNNPMLSKLIKELEIGSRIHLLGERRDTPQLTAGLDISTSSSYFGEAFPNIIGEAMACAVPCVVTDVGDSARIVGDTGKVIPPKNPKALANAWKELIVIGEEKRKVLGQKARQRIIESFSLDSIVAQYENLYESVLTAECGQRNPVVLR